MNKIETSVVAVLFAALIGWGFYQSKQAPAPQPQAAVQNAVPGQQPAPGTASPTIVDGTIVSPSTIAASDGTVVTPAATRKAEQTVTLSSDDIVLTMSSHGGGVVDAQVSNYFETRADESGPLHLNFEAQPALTYLNLEGVDLGGDFTVTSDGTEAVLIAKAANGLTLTRRVTLKENYRFSVEDTFSNTGSNMLRMDGYSISLGAMSLVKTTARTPGYTYLGIDTLASGEKGKVKHWGKKMNDVFGVKSAGCSTPSALGLPAAASQSIDFPVDWVAAKNKFFVQILAPEDGAVNCNLQAFRDMSSTNALVIDAVAGNMEFDAMALPPGDSFTRAYGYYVGPKKDKVLKLLENRQREVMQFGWFGWYRGVCRGLLWTLNAIHTAIPNYGIAIILLTVLVRLLFWPILQKSTEHMRRMQKVQPLMTAIREKHKEDPQKMNTAMMALYKEHKVNPMAGCLPMVIQIPVFFALFTVLRSAVELRFAPFLWVQDLSEPEGLLADVLPIPLNILPLLMTATTVLQQKMTPMGGDPAQRKMMMMMPVVFLFMLYNMPSALVLYWTTSQGLAILQMQMQKNKEKKSGEPEIIAPPKPKVEPKAPWEQAKDKQRKRAKRNKR
jgi:YidC/Oxa1 family membrane protein insertase